MKEDLSRAPLVPRSPPMPLPPQPRRLAGPAAGPSAEHPALRGATQRRLLEAPSTAARSAR